MIKKIVCLLSVAMFIACIPSARQLPPDVIVREKTAQVVYSVYCCDALGNHRCVMNVAGPVGANCWCNYQGAGVVCE
jgi:hypothetical protein